MRWFSFLVFSCALLSSAKILVYDNLEFKGNPLLIPQVQKESYHKGQFHLPELLTVELPDSESLIVEQFNEQLKRLGNFSAQKAARGVCRLVLTEENVPASREGYTLKITEQEICVASRDTAGLYYGSQTLRNMLRNAQKPVLPCCELEDYPDFDLRGTGLSISRVPEERWGDFLKAVDALASLKMNGLRFNVAESFPYEGFKLAKTKMVFSREKLQALSEYCRHRHLQVIPTIQVLSHTQWMTYHEDWEKMSEGTPRSRWNSQCCIQNEQAREITRMALEEQIAMFHPKIFYVCLDELSLGPFRSCPRCKAKPASELLRDYMTFLRDIVEKKHGVRLFICQDNLFNKADWPYGDTFRSNITSNDLINWWSYKDRLPVDSMVFFKDFDVNGHALSGKPFNMYNMLKLMKSYGKRSATTAYWYYSQNGTLFNFNEETPDSLGGSVLAADMMWHFTEEHPYHQAPYDATWEMMRRIYPEQAVKPRRQQRAVSVPLASVINSEISSFEDMPKLDGATALELKRTLAQMPENFVFNAMPDGRYYGLQLSGSTSEKQGRSAIAIPVNHLKASAFSCLMTASPTNDTMGYYSAGVYGRKRLKYPAGAYFSITYADGQHIDVPVRYRFGFTDWNRPFSGFGMRFALRCLDIDTSYFSMGVFEFSNPRPDVAVQSIVFGTHRLDGVRPVLLALSAWDADKVLENPPFSPDRMLMSYQPHSLEEAKPHIIEDFEQGTGTVYLTYPPQLNGKIQMERTMDPKYPERGQVLKVTVPPAIREGTGDAGAYVRVSVDCDYTHSQKSKGLFFRYRIEGDSDNFSHSNQYLTERARGQKDSAKLNYVAYPMSISFNTRWVPAYASLKKQKGNSQTVDFQKMKTRRISFFFHKIAKPTVIYIDDIGDSEAELKVQLPLFGPHTESETL